MSDSLKMISESIDAVRGSIHVDEGVIAECHLDILLSQIADEIRRAHRGLGSAQALAKMIEGKL